MNIDPVWLQWSEFLSYVVTILFLPCGIIAFLLEQKKERANEEEEINQRLADEYTGFLKLVLQNSDLNLLRKTSTIHVLDDEQKERRFALFGILISIFERAYILVYEERMNRQQRRLWLSWEDYMREWCQRKDFLSVLPELLEGEDEDFGKHIKKIANEEAKKNLLKSTVPTS